jgi:hypothetical protein
MVSSRTVVARYINALEFPTPRALRDYLHNHPKADRSKHTVAKPGPKPEAQKEEKAPEKKVPVLPANLESRIKKALKSIPKAAHKFVTDAEHRKSSLANAAQGLKKTPGHFVTQALKHTRDEIDTYKHASHGVKAMFKGQKLSKEQKKAVQELARDVAVQIAITTLLGGGGLAGKAVYGFVTGIGKKIAINVITADGIGDIQGDMEDVRDLVRIGKYTTKVLGKFFRFADEAPDPMTLFGTLVAAKVYKGIQNLSIEDILDSVN